MPNLIFLFITLIFLVACEYSRLPSLLTARGVSRANFQSRGGETTVFSEYFLASVQALMSNLTFDRLGSCQNSLHLIFSVQHARFATSKSE